VSNFENASNFIIRGLFNSPEGYEKLDLEPDG
jgi:hypothetical protein